MRIYKEITSDKGSAWPLPASNNNAEYVMTSAFAHSAIYEFLVKYDRWPSSSWYNKHFNFERVK